MSFPEFGYIFFFFFSVASFLVFRLFMSSSIFGYKGFFILPVPVCLCQVHEMVTCSISSLRSFSLCRVWVSVTGKALKA